MLIKDHKIRVARLMRGERRVDDLRSLFLDLRMNRPPRASVQEIGHFAAHRQERETGISLARANDIQTSARLWVLRKTGTIPSADDLEKAGLANLRIMPEAKIKAQFGILYQTAFQTFSKAIRKFRTERPLKVREVQVLSRFGLSMMWQFALSDDVLFADFVHLLIEEGALKQDAVSAFEPISPFVTLYALSIMHGARLKMADGGTSWLRLARSDTTGLLRIKAEITACTVPKPVTFSVPMFETTLSAEKHCDPALLAWMGEPVPAEIEDDRLVKLA